MKDNKSFCSQDYLGFGDNIYKRPFLVQAAANHKRIYLGTCFPELVSDIPNIICCKPDTKLKTQLRNSNETSYKYFHTMPYHPRLYFNYNAGFIKNLNVIQTFEQVVPIGNEWSFQFKPRTEWLDKARHVLDKHGIHKFVVVRPPTVRVEWSNYSRNCYMDYINFVIREVPEEYTLVVVGDCGNQEEFYGNLNLPENSLNLAFSGLDIWSTVGLVWLSTGVISSVSFMLPLCSAFQKPLFCIWGGQIKPDLLVDKRMGLDHTTIIAPDNPCNCIQNNHECEKHIPMSRLDIGVQTWVNKYL